MRVTPSARVELLGTVAKLQREDPDLAARFVLEVEDRLTAIRDGREDAPEMDSPWRSAETCHGHRLYVRERTDDLWLIAVWSPTQLPRKPPTRPPSKQ